MHGPAVEFATARITLISALSWRAIAELFRRYQPAYDLRVTQVHPGISIRGALELEIITSDKAEPAKLSFNLGGPSGTCGVIRSLSPHGPEQQVVEFARPMLSGDPSFVIDQLAAACGLPSVVVPIPPSSKTTITIRVIAGLMERLVFHRESWRTTAGFCANDAAGNMVPDWLSALGVDETVRRQASETADSDAIATLSRRILVHRSPSDAPCLHLTGLRGTAWAFDLASGIATVLTAEGPGQQVALPSQYMAAQRDLRRLVGEIESALV